MEGVGWRTEELLRTKGIIVLHTQCEQRVFKPREHTRPWMIDRHTLFFSVWLQRRAPEEH